MSRSLALISVPVFALLTAACDPAASGDGTRYQKWAETVSTIPLDPASDQGETSQHSLALETAPPPASDKRLRVELMTPHQLWDARNGPLKVPTMEVLENVSPTELVTTNHAATTPRSIPAPTPSASLPVPTATKLIQLGAFSNDEGARNAWKQVQAALGTNGSAALQPRYETVEVAGRQLVRLRVAASDADALRLCQALASNDPWCKSPAR